ncbi:MAG: hypothetical protein WAK17_21630 [Candidatus Nitrosopolaris sp.]
MSLLKSMPMPMPAHIYHFIPFAILCHMWKTMYRICTGYFVPLTIGKHTVKREVFVWNDNWNLMSAEALLRYGYNITFTNRGARISTEELI